jgi:hypothetical protein
MTSYLFLTAARIAASVVSELPKGIDHNDKMLVQIASGGDWKTAIWKMFVESPTAVAAMSGLVILAFLFFPRWRNPRNGIFLFSVIVIIVRMWNPDNIFWQILAPTGAVLSMGIFVYMMAAKNYQLLKEPTYFVFNAFSMFMMSFTVSTFTLILAIVSTAVSLFFIVTMPSAPPERFKNRNADPNIMDSLAKRAQRKW